MSFRFLTHAHVDLLNLFFFLGFSTIQAHSEEDDSVNRSDDAGLYISMSKLRLAAVSFLGEDFLSNWS